MTRFAGMLCLTFWLSSVGCASSPRYVPGPPTPCTVPTFHTQAECQDNVDCLLNEFSLALEREHEVDAALARCSNVRRGS